MCPCIKVQLETFSNPNLSKTSIVARCPLAWSKTSSVFAEQPIKHSTRPGALVTSGSQETSTPALVGNEKIGVLLLNLGGPETLDDVQPFLFNLFADPVSVSSLLHSLHFAGNLWKWLTILFSIVFAYWEVGYYSIAKIIPLSSKALGAIYICS